MVWDAYGFPEGVLLTLSLVPLRIVSLCSLTSSLLSNVILFHIEE